ncbi:AraC family transcriptional regulator [Glaciecola sp. 1036]|uniref:AraC family transcriptional regulator n=1 Tax=Alteromonadaceae TaxID=72275 RepID=UPI003CFDF45B
MEFDHTQRTATTIDDGSLSKLLNNLQMKSAFYTASELRKPWSTQMPPMLQCMMFHFVVEGDATFSCGDESLELSQGDFILFPKGEGHIVSDGECKTATPLAELPIECITERYEKLTFGGNGELTRLVCGAMVFDHPLAKKIVEILPSFILIKKSNVETASLIESISQLLKSESQQISLGAEAVISRLAEILVIAALREFLGQLNETSLAWLGALEDDRIGKAMKLIHDSPDKHWSLEGLAKEVGMSRTSFSQQFKRLVGDTPMEYLTEWRMSLAFSKLTLSKDTVLSIALDIGYQSESAFSRVFKKVIGKSPREVRRSAEPLS